MSPALLKTRVYWVAGAGFLALAVAVGASSQTRSSQVGSLTVVSQLVAFDSGTAVDQSTAAAVALKSAHDLRPELTGLRVSASNRANGLREVKDSNGQVIYTDSGGVNAWVIELKAPSQLGYRYVSGAAVVDASSGKIRAVSILLSNQ